MKVWIKLSIINQQVIHFLSGINQPNHVKKSWCLILFWIDSWVEINRYMSKWFSTANHFCHVSFELTEKCMGGALPTLPELSYATWLSITLPSGVIIDPQDHCGMGGLGKEANGHKLQQQQIVAKGASLSKVDPPIVKNKKHTGSLAGKTLTCVWPVRLHKKHGRSNSVQGSQTPFAVIAYIFISMTKRHCRTTECIYI